MKTYTIKLTAVELNAVIVCLKVGHYSLKAKGADPALSGPMYRAGQKLTKTANKANVQLDEAEQAELKSYWTSSYQLVDVLSEQPVSIPKTNESVN